ncbi:MAG: ABC transporter ATP-binding protein [Cocleimonas sp.]|nr:ABC transporter ATP-binding protein [Cocleimonas sp.]
MSSNNNKLAVLHDVTKVYQTGVVKVEALQGINLTLEREKFSFIVGPSGSGKTTLLNILGCIDVPSSGRFTLLNQEIGGLNDNQLADFRNHHIGYIFQNFNLMAVLSAYENVEYPLILKNIAKKERHQRVSEILDSVGLSKRQHHRPAELSGGEQQRVAIARALAKRPDLILADEPTANLDSKTGAEIIDLMLLMQDHYKTSFIFSTHDMEVMQHANEIITIKDGKIESVNTTIMKQKEGV